MGIPVIDTGPMTVKEFYDFTDHRPDGEKWELIDGEAIMNARPSDSHQTIALNVASAPLVKRRESNASWHVLPGLGVTVSGTSRPEPDVLVLPQRARSTDLSRRETDSALVIFEVMSPSTSSRDLKWKRTAYTSVPTLTHYVVIAQDAIDVVVFARDDGFAERRLTSLSDNLVFSELGVTLPLVEIYRDVPLS